MLHSQLAHEVHRASLKGPVTFEALTLSEALQQWPLLFLVYPPIPKGIFPSAWPERAAKDMRPVCLLRQLEEIELAASLLCSQNKA